MASGVRDRRVAVVEYPLPIGALDPAVSDALQRLQGTVGLVTSLLVIPLVVSAAGVGLTASGSGTVVDGSQTTWNLEDARVQQVRVVGYGGSSGTGDTVRLFQGSTELAQGALAGSTGRFTGSWMTVDLSAGDLAFEVKVVGNGVRTQTLYRVELHARTVRAR